MQAQPDAGAFRSGNSGESWSAINAGLELMAQDPVYYHSVSALAIDPWHNNRAAALYGASSSRSHPTPGAR